MSDQQDTEIILGTGKLLGIFFGLVIICGTFFGIGYSVGRSSSPMAIQSERAATVVNSSGAKPGAGVTISTPTAAPEVTQSANPNSVTPQTEQVPPAANDASANTDAAPAQTPASASLKTVAASDSPRAPTADGPGPGSSITVQVAAVTKQEDAQALVAALRRKNYPVFVAPSPSPDNLYHVQVGPFAELKDAEAMKSKLAGDGYNAIVKK